jgi:hypothetical protein
MDVTSSKPQAKPGRDTASPGLNTRSQTAGDKLTNIAGGGEGLSGGAKQPRKAGGSGGKGHGAGLSKK